MEIEKLTTKIALVVLETIKNYRYDYDRAHNIEDEVRETFIKGLSIGLYNHEEAMQIAGILIQSSDIPFPRECA